MMLRFLATLVILGLTSSAVAQDSANLGAITRDIRAGNIDVGRTYSMGVDGDDRFHNIHSDAIGLGCKSCHSGKAYHDDYILLRKGEILPKDARGQAERGVCLGCHRTGGPASTWFVGRETK
jgi:hypothetical protein